jgi:glycosyltransferase 2 family protein
MKNIWSNIKTYIRWMILGGTLFFVLKAFKDRWQEVAAVRIESKGWLMLAIALTVTLLAHVWAGWVWSWILLSFKQTLPQRWAIQVYLKTNLAKYFPGNVWHYYGRIAAVSRAGGSLAVASLSVLLEPLLMVAAALIVISISVNLPTWGLQIFSLTAVLVGIHPLILNPIVQFLSRLKGNIADPDKAEIKKYPWLPLLGELGFLGLRGLGFLFIFLALKPLSLNQIPQLFGVFSCAWLLGLIVPGAPGGLGVFEATAIALLDQEQFPSGIVLSVVALYRMISILAEAIAAGLALI